MTLRRRSDRKPPHQGLTSKQAVGRCFVCSSGRSALPLTIVDVDEGGNDSRKRGRLTGWSSFPSSPKANNV